MGNLRFYPEFVFFFFFCGKYCIFFSNSRLISSLQVFFFFPCAHTWKFMHIFQMLLFIVVLFSLTNIFLRLYCYLLLLMLCFCYVSVMLICCCFTCHWSVIFISSDVGLILYHIGLRIIGKLSLYTHTLSPVATLNLFLSYNVIIMNSYPFLVFLTSLLLTVWQEYNN